MQILAIALSVFFLVLGNMADAGAAAKKTGRDVYSKEQQKKFYEEAVKRCRKEYGSQLHYVKVDYSKGGPRLWCYHY